MDQNIVNNALEINLDYMKALYLFLQTEYNITSLVSTIRHLYNFLTDLHLSNDIIKDAINLLYDDIDSSKLDEVNHILNRLITHANYNSSILAYMNNINENLTNNLNNMIDTYTGDIINPTNIFAQNNLNQLFNTINPTTNIFNTIMSNYRVITFINPPLTNNNIIRNANGKETLSQIALDKLVLVSFKNLDTEIKKKFETCLICLDDFKEETIIRKIKCMHLFHKDCIDSWLLKESFKCPLCRDSAVDIDNNEDHNDPYDADDEENNPDADDEEHQNQENIPDQNT